MKHALVRYMLDIERGLSKAVQDLGAEQLRLAQSALASTPNTSGIRRDLLLAISRKLESK